VLDARSDEPRSVLDARSDEPRSVLDARSDEPRSVSDARSDEPRSVFDPALAWRLHPQVAVRPERFGALLYHFGTRKLSFLKDRTILAIVESIGEHPDARSACRAAGVEPGGERPYLHALKVLASSNMLVGQEQP
jgi:mycofactocin biosynthesis protein MftB